MFTEYGCAVLLMTCVAVRPGQFGLRVMDWPSSNFMTSYDRGAVSRLSQIPSPSTISEERKTNLFLRAKNVEEFTMLRRHKDNWKC